MRTKFHLLVASLIALLFAGSVQGVYKLVQPELRIC